MAVNANGQRQRRHNFLEIAFVSLMTSLMT